MPMINVIVEAATLQDLPQVERFVFVVLTMFSDANGKNIWPGIATLRGRTGLCERVIKKALASLEKQGWIVPDGKHGKVQQYAIPLEKLGLPTPAISRNGGNKTPSQPLPVSSEREDIADAPPPPPAPPPAALPVPSALPPGGPRYLTKEDRDRIFGVSGRRGPLKRRSDAPAQGEVIGFGALGQALKDFGIEQ